jgi:UDP-glucose 4-epimerase
VAQAFIAALAAAALTAPVVNVCTGRATSVNHLARLLFELTGKVSEIHYAPARDGEIRASVGNACHAGRLLGLVDPTALEDGLARLLRAT